MQQLPRGVWSLPFRDEHGYAVMVAVDRSGRAPFGLTRYFPADDPVEVALMLRRRLDETDPESHHLRI